MIPNQTHSKIGEIAFKTFFSVALMLAFVGCKTEEPEIKNGNPTVPTTQLPNTNTNDSTLKWVDVMKDGFALGWNAEEYNGGLWKDSASIKWAYLNNNDPLLKSRCEINRLLFNFVGNDKTYSIKGKFILPDRADSKSANMGGWVMQTMCWNFPDKNGNTAYAPLVVLTMNANYISCLVYDYQWAEDGTATAKPGYPLFYTLHTATSSRPIVNTPFTIELKITFSKFSTGEVKPYVNGTLITSAIHKGVTYPAIFPVNGQRIQWKAGCYSASVKVYHGLIGIYSLETDAF